MGTSVPFTESYRNNRFKIQIFFKNLDIILSENRQGVDPTGLSASLVDIKTLQILKCHQQP